MNRLLTIDQIYNFQAVKYQYLIYTEIQVQHDQKIQQPNNYIIIYLERENNFNLEY